MQLPTDNSATLSLLDSALRRFLSLSAAYHGMFHSLDTFQVAYGFLEQYLQTPLQLDHACTMLLDSELFQFHSERMCDIIMTDIQMVRALRSSRMLYAICGCLSELKTTDPHTQFIFYHVLLSYGQRRAPFLRNQKRWQKLLPLLMDYVLVDIDPDVEDTYFGGSGSGSVVPVPIEAKLRSLGIKILYEVCRVQKPSLADLSMQCASGEFSCLIFGFQEFSMIISLITCSIWWNRLGICKTRRSTTRLSS